MTHTIVVLTIVLLTIVVLTIVVLTIVVLTIVVLTIVVLTIVVLTDHCPVARLFQEIGLSMTMADSIRSGSEM